MFQKRHKRQLDLEILDDEVAERELIQIYAETVILGWEQGPLDKPEEGVIPGPDGKDLPFSRDNTIKLLMDLPELFTDIRTQSTKLALFREALKAEDAGNS